jgi:hypothetical protein
MCCQRNVELEIADKEQTILTYWANNCCSCGRMDLLVGGDEEANFSIKKSGALCGCSTVVPPGGADDAANRA